MKLSVIVPVLNEERVLPRLLRGLEVLRRSGVEVIVVDGGSADGSQALVVSAGIALVCAMRGRAQQMNAGAATAFGDVLLFLHADTRLPDGAKGLIDAALTGNRHVWGRFDVRLDGVGWRLRVVAAAMNVRSRLTGIATGDQAIFARRSVFERVGGFPLQPLMEDIELSRRLRAISRPVCIRARAVTSARRWESRGVGRTIVLMWWLRFAYWCGVSPERLARRYQ